MESKNIYLESVKELNVIKKNLSTDSVTIDFSKLDSGTAGLLRDEIYKAITSRIGTISQISLGVQ